MDKNVSRETIEKLALYNTILNKWNRAHNLIDQKTIYNSFNRHFEDSLQLLKHIDGDKSLLDTGSGAGFPGMVLAMAGCKDVTLVEANKKKCIFLEEIARQTDTKVVILNKRIEEVKGSYCQITARAFSTLSMLLKIMENVSRETEKKGYFLKGKSWKEEIESAHDNNWVFSYENFPSLTSSESSIIKVWNIKKDETGKNISHC